MTHTATAEPTTTTAAAEPVTTAAAEPAVPGAPVPAAVLDRLLPRRRGEEGFTTAELLAAAALSVAALVVIFGLLTNLGEQVVGWIEGKILSS